MAEENIHQPDFTTTSRAARHRRGYMYAPAGLVIGLALITAQLLPSFHVLIHPHPGAAGHDSCAGMTAGGTAKGAGLHPSGPTDEHTSHPCPVCRLFFRSGHPVILAVVPTVPTLCPGERMPGPATGTMPATNIHFLSPRGPPPA